MSDTRTGVFDYAMPSLGADMDEGSVIEWLVSVGDRVDRGQVVARVETEKSDIDIEIWHSGLVEEILVEPNRVVPVGTTLLRLHTDDAGPTTQQEPDPPISQEPAPLPAPQHDEPTPHEEPTQGAEPLRDSAVWASPLARRRAGDLGIVLSEVIGSGPYRAVRASDVDAAVRDRQENNSSAVHATPSSGERQALRMRSAIATRMAVSNREIPHYRLQRDVELGALVEHLSSINAERPIADRIVPAAAFVRAVAIAAHRHPELNGTWSDDGFQAGNGVHVSVAISLRGGGLVTPTIRDADSTGLDEVMRLLREFTVAARAGTLRSAWTSGESTITVTNLGERGADLVHGLISPPEVALVGFGRIVERPWVIDGSVVARPVVAVTLGADHRATDGALGSRFLATVARALEEPEQL